MKLYNTLTLSKVALDLESPKEFRMFVCGPTVQDNVHLGHAKTYLAFDLLARWLLRKGRKVFFLLNITDIDDKIFDRAKKEGVPYTDIADKFYNAFLEDIEALNIETVSRFQRVSKYVDRSSQLAKQLLDAGIAYELGRTRNVYYDTSKAHDFGKLSHQGPLELRLKQIDAAPGKKNTVDFLLWRSVSDASEGVWQGPTGPGRPGWHIQDSAIAFEEFGGPYDLHGGATELIFPHHEAELAQDESISNEIPFVGCWMHTGLLLKGPEKMSKSLGNVVTIREALKNYTADEIRFHFLKHHYKESLEYSDASMNDSKREFSVVEKASRVLPKTGKRISEISEEHLAKIWKDFSTAMDDDLSSQKAISALLKASELAIDSEKFANNREELTSLFWDMAETLGFSMSA